MSEKEQQHLFLTCETRFMQNYVAIRVGILEREGDGDCEWKSLNRASAPHWRNTY
jgi:hypothetical protein